MRRRLPIIAALALVASALGAWTLGPAAQRAWDRHQQQAQLHRLSPGIAMLVRLDLPGTSPCLPALPDPRPQGQLCWHTTSLPALAASDLVAGLKRVGATDTRARCVTAGVLGPRCTVLASVAGFGFSALVMPQVSPMGSTHIVGAEFSGGLDELGPWPTDLPSGRPVPLPTSGAELSHG